MMELTTYTELEIAHRLMTSYAQKCRSLHGHRYEVEITVTAQKLNEDGMIVDFKKLKEVVKTVLDDKWDHGSCFKLNDPLGKAAKESGSERVHITDANPTLEWMVEHWVLELQAELNAECPGVAVSMLKASETARNTVTWRCNRLPWEISQPRDNSKKPEYTETEREAALRRRPERALRPAPKNDWASPGATVKVDSFPPTDEQEETNPDASLYLVQFRTERMPYSTTVRTAHTGELLIARCKTAAQAFVDRLMETAPNHIAGDAVAVLLNITKLPG